MAQLPPFRLPEAPARTDLVAAMLELAHGLLASNPDHVAACCRIPEA